jgi:hypothetical protein
MLIVIFCASLLCCAMLMFLFLCGSKKYDVKNLKLAAIQHKNKNLEPTQLKNPLCTDCRSPRVPGPLVEKLCST